ncbi:unnamed protein product, partial [Parnassius mnemosyne]
MTIDHKYAKKRHIDHSYSQLAESASNKLPRLTVSVTSTLTPVENAVASSSSEIQDAQVTLTTMEHSIAAFSTHAIASSGTTSQDTQQATSTTMKHTVASSSTHAVASSSTASQDTPQGSSCKTPRKLLKRRLLRNFNSLTPRCQLFYKKYKKAKRQIDYRSRTKKALAFSKEKSLEELTKNMNPLTKKVLWMQVKLCTKNKKARRFTREEKLIALSIYKQGPKSYKFLQKIFILPSKTTLKKMISQLNIDTGINPEIFKHMSKQIAKWDDRKKICSVIFDEMAIETALTYAAHKDNIVGFVDLNGKINEFADHALVFMLRGAVFKWQQPVAFYFCEGATSSLQLKKIIKNIISALTDIGLKPIALVSDQGSSFQSAVNSLLDDTKREQLRAGETVDDTIHLNGNSLSVIFDPPHLLKGIRNNLLTKDMMFEGKRVTWNDIVDVYNADCKHGESRILHKLTDQHVIPDKIKKMKVKNCVRVLSKSVSAALSYTSAFPLYPDGSPISKTLKNTAAAVSFFDDLFDSVNGASTNEKMSKGKNLRKVVTLKSAHHEFWNKAIKILQGIKFICKDGTLKSVPSLKNWIITLKSLKRVWELLASKNIKIMRPRYFNSDIIENFFGQVRAYNYRSNDPTAYTFINTFKSLLVTRFINFHSESYNCEEDVSQGVLDIQSLFENVNIAPSSDSKSDATPVCKTVEFVVENFEEQARRERINVHSRTYTAGWVTRKILCKINCKECKHSLLSEDSNIHDFI